MEIAVEEHLDALIRPAPQPARKGRSRNDWRLTPVVRNDEHREPPTDVRTEDLEKMVDFRLKKWCDVMNRREKEAVIGSRH